MGAMGTVAAGYTVELEPEVRAWLELLPGRLFRRVETYAELLAERGPDTPSPFARTLRDGVAELRPMLDGVATRVTYWINRDERRIVLLTVFRKTRTHEQAQIERAVRAKLECEAAHGAAHGIFVREGAGGT
ncbi:type II toxin-antitoxin system RelE/ParE family toxin [Streptacidiphilus neutrinimicus]|uniref:type II toxin-antitoxin system RelE/ParE family toxin n=1 Tax=Streptacidiphilus neutrinimicus TaxID=105420 RepID=UPI001F27F476|nr:type II toxin-antitoxin system RelE/ParE family toxin [Streptacidiphilus neutrinimicus]